MSTRTLHIIRFFLVLILLQGLVGCSGTGLPPTPTQAATTTPSPMPTASVTSSVTSSPTLAPTATSIPKISHTIDLVAYHVEHGTGWFTQSMADLPEATQNPDAVFEILTNPIQNRRNGNISPILISNYMFIQFGDISSDDLEEHAKTLRGLFIRSALLSFVDYPANRVLDWDWRADKIPMNVAGIIKKANELNLPVFLEINYSDYVPGPIGSGPEALQSADNIANTVSYLESLQAQGLIVDGVTFGDEIGDEAGFGTAKPTFLNSDLIERYVAYARALKNRFPELKIYAFDSYIAATRGEVSQSLDLLNKVRQAEVKEGINLIDGFVFRESYVYMDEKGRILNSQAVLDDIESLAGTAPVMRYDVMGNKHQKADRGYLLTLVKQTQEILNRTIDIGITEYLPAGPVQISESDTSIYQDIDFVIHYADLVGTYAEQGLDVVSTWMFANDTDQSKCYVDRQGGQGLNYPVHEQLAQYFKGSILQVQRPVPYSDLRVKVYVAKEGENYFIMVLNKNTQMDHSIRLVLSGEFDFMLRIPAKSYTSLHVSQDEVIISGVGP